MSAAAIHPIIEEVQGHLLEIGTLELNLKCLYLVDGILAEDQEPVAAAIDFIEMRLEGIGLELNRDRCELIPTAGMAHALEATRFPGVRM